MKIRTYLVITGFIVTVFGCASIEPSLNVNSRPDVTGGYIAGSFTRKSSGGFAFAITNVQTNQEYSMSLGADTSMPTDVEDQVTAIKVPPGQYVVSAWYTYGTLNKAKNSINKITNPYLARPFEVTPSSVLYLGRFIATTAYERPTSSSTTVSYVIKPERVTTNQARSTFFTAYPLFKELPFRCQLCAD